MSTLLVAVVFAIGLLLAELREGRLRLLGTAAMLAMEAVALSATGGGQAAAWVAGPLLASAALVSRPSPPLPFERLMLRTAVVTALVFSGGYLARRLPFGDLPWGLEAMGWVLAAIGLAWLSMPRDRMEARRGAVLAIAGGGAVLLTLYPAGVAPMAIAGLMTLAPLFGERSASRGEARKQSILPSIGLGAIAVAVAALDLSGRRPDISVAGLPASFDPTALTGLALLLLVAALSVEPTVAIASLLAGLSLLMASPAPRWAALAAAVAVLAWEAGAARQLWAGVSLLGLAPALSGLIAGPLGARWAAASMAAGWLLVLLARMDRWAGALVLAASTFYVEGVLHRLGSLGVLRFQWLAVAGVGVALVMAASRPDAGRTPGTPWRLRSVMTSGLILVGVATAVPLGLLGAALLVVDLALVQASAPSGPPAMGALARAGLLARSGWPPSAAFAGRVLVLLAATSASLLLAVTAILLVTGLQIAPRWDQPPPARPLPRAGLRDWLATGISLGAGVAPAVLLRMLQGG